MIKVSFYDPVLLSEIQDPLYAEEKPIDSQHMFVLTNKIQNLPKLSSNDTSTSYMFHGYWGFTDLSNIKSIEHVKPTDL